MTAKLNPRTARNHLQAFRFADLFIEDLGWSYPDSRKPMSLDLEGQGWIAVEISQLAGFRVFEVTAADPAAPFPDAKTQQALWKRIAPHAVENLLIFVDAERTRSAWLWMKRDGSKDSPTRRPQTHPRRHHYLKGQPGDLFLSKLASLVVDLTVSSQASCGISFSRASPSPRASANPSPASRSATSLISTAASSSPTASKLASRAIPFSRSPTPPSPSRTPSSRISSPSSPATPGLSTTPLAATTARSTPTCSATSSRNTSTRRNSEPTTPARKSPITSASRPSTSSCSTG